MLSNGFVWKVWLENGLTHWAFRFGAWTVYDELQELWRFWSVYRSWVLHTLDNEYTNLLILYAFSSLKLHTQLAILNYDLYPQFMFNAITNNSTAITTFTKRKKTNRTNPTKSTKVMNSACDERCTHTKWWMDGRFTSQKYVMDVVTVVVYPTATANVLTDQTIARFSHYTRTIIAASTIVSHQSEFDHLLINLKRTNKIIHLIGAVCKWNVWPKCYDSVSAYFCFISKRFFFGSGMENCWNWKLRNGMDVKSFRLY